MSILFEITQQSPIIVVVSGGVNDGTYSRNMGNNLRIDLQMTGGATLYNAGGGSYTALTNSMPNFLPGTADTDATEGQCCEVRNSSGSSLNHVELYAGSTLDIVSGLADTESVYFLTQSPIINTVFQIEPCTSMMCVREDTKVSIGQNKYKNISDLVSGDHAIDYAGREIEILDNFESGKSDRFVKIPKNALGKHVPLYDIFIKSGHPIIYGLYEMPCEMLIGSIEGVEEIQLEKSFRIFTLITKRRNFIMMNGLPVATWNKEEFEAIIENNKS